MWPAGACEDAASGVDGASWLAGAGYEAGGGIGVEAATKVDDSGATAGGSARPVSSLPQDWQLVCPRKISLAPQNWHVWLAAPCPRVKLNLSIRQRADYRPRSARQYDPTNYPKDRLDPARVLFAGPNLQVQPRAGAGAHTAGLAVAGAGLNPGAAPPPP
jgi:hypothetical protein